MSLTNLECSDTRVSDLSPLQGMSIINLYCADTEATDLTPLHGCKDLRYLSIHGKGKVTPAEIEALKKAVPGCHVD